MESVLGTLTQPRLLDLGRLFGVAIRNPRESKPRLLKSLSTELSGQLARVLQELGREELRAVCRGHALSDTGRAREELQRRILEAAGVDPNDSLPPPPDRHTDGLPRPGQFVQARHRQWLVEDVIPGGEGESALVKLACVDDDDAGRALEVLWDLELGARVVSPEAQGLGAVTRVDPPAHFGAYLHALKWSAVSAADASRFQAPFRAGIKLMAHQLTPLMKALELPRANLFIADDVGLGKTIEAGLVLQELLLRQQADFVLIVCPASVCLQWRDEMQRRFGLRFEVMTRQFIAYRRQDRGFGVNPWATYSRFIVSHSLIRRPEYRDPLLVHLGRRARKGLFILDEAHAAAPASASQYAVDTEFTATIRDLAPRFDNRLFLSATPHNGHSNSFSALLEILDPVRFTRGVPVDGRKDLESVMVRRLKRDLRKLGVERFPRRLLIELRLENAANAWSVEERSYDAETGERAAPRSVALGPGEPIDLAIAEKLARYTELMAPKKGRPRLVFIQLQKRLLSSPEAFARTLEMHHAALLDQKSPVLAPPPAKLEPEADPDTHGVDDEVTSAEEDAEVFAESRELPSPAEEARGLLSELRALAARARRAPDAKARALLAWMREQLCPAIGLDESAKVSRKWSKRRVILFTEYAATKTYFVELLAQAIAHTEDPEGRIRTFHGGMGDDARSEVQRAFNAAPDDDPVRILVATDAAREGVNLQAHCADLFHLDIPWNPARLEQRNGRIDRTLQPADTVRCHYFVYPERPEDRVLETLMRKVDVVERELGSLGAVLLSELEDAFKNGITSKTQESIERIGEDTRKKTVSEELEGSRDDLEALRGEIQRAGHRLETSRRALEVDPDSLRGVVEVGLALAGASRLASAEPASDGRPTYRLPALDRSWDRTLDSLRPPRERTESFWDFRQKPPRPVTFHPLTELGDEAEQLHLAHPFVQRILDRFLAQGFGAHDLSRVTVLVAPDDSVVRVVGYARLTLFGRAAARLHDEIVPVAAAWSGDAAGIEPYKDAVTAARTVTTVEQLLARGAKAPSSKVFERVRREAGTLFAALWPALEAEADARAVEARKGLAERGRREAGELRRLLERQGVAIQKAQARLRQAELFAGADREQKRQVELDLVHLEKRSTDLRGELDTEPKAIEALYEIQKTRIVPVALVVSYPEALT